MGRRGAGAQNPPRSRRLAFVLVLMLVPVLGVSGSCLAGSGFSVILFPLGGESSVGGDFSDWDIARRPSVSRFALGGWRPVPRADAVTGFRVRTVSLGSSRKACLTRRSSSEWKLMTAPGRRA